jgi:hypothetical protein
MIKAGSTCQRIVARAADQRVVAASGIERIVEYAADVCVGQRSVAGRVDPDRQ